MHAIKILCIEVHRLTVGCSEPADHKVLGRRRSALVLEQVMRAGVLSGQWPVAEPSS
jgi:predicted methyltransferase